MNSLPELVSGRDVRWGRDPFLDAWLLHASLRFSLQAHAFLKENNCDVEVEKRATETSHSMCL